MSQYRIERPDSHDRSGFDCGVPALDSYLRERAKQDIRRRVSRCFVAVDDRDAVAGFYTIAATSIPIDQLPEAQARQLSKYPAVPAILLGRLAVARSHQGRQLGAALVADAVERGLRADAMAYAIVVDAKDAAAAGFYSYLAFEPTVSNPLRLIRRL